MADDKFLSAIRAGKRRFRARFAKRDNEAGTGPDWSEPRDVELCVALRDKPLKARGVLHPAGEILAVTPTDFNWAEAGERDYEDGCFMVEEYRMELLEVPE